MLKRQLIYFALPFLLLTGCGTDKTVEKTDKKTEAAEETKKEKLTKEEYPVKLVSLTADFTKELSALQTIAASDKDNDVKLEEANQKIDELLKMTKEFSNLEAPQEYEDTQKRVEKAMSHYSKAFQYEKDAVKDRGNQELLTKSMEEIQLASADWAEAYEQIQKIQLGTSEGDGIETDERDSPLNLSKKELAGHWEAVKTDEELSLIMEEDETFEYYFDDTYPKKTDYVEGHWKYDSQAKRLTLTGEKFYTDGEKEDTGPEDLEFIVKDFSGNQLEIQEEDTSEELIKLERR